MNEPQNVIGSILQVIEQASWVSIDDNAIADVADRLAASNEALPEWDAQFHPVGRDTDETATLVLILDALNYCFWPLPGSSGPRWGIEYRGRMYDGYMALALALRKAVEGGVPLSDPDFLVGLDLHRVRELLSPAPGTQEIPLIESRLTRLHEVGIALQDHWNGSFAHAIASAGGSAMVLVEEVVATLSSFRDTAIYRNKEVLFYKRAQILIADLHGALHDSDYGKFDDLDHLTAFADYKVPQILRCFGILKYHPDLSRSIRNYELIPPGDEREIELRAATIWAVELLRRKLQNRNKQLRAFEIDWLLWNAAQNLPHDTEPYHRTLTIYY